MSFLALGKQFTLPRTSCVKEGWILSSLARGTCSRSEENLMEGLKLGGCTLVRNFVNILL